MQLHRVKFIKYVVVGMFIGSGAILPGVSGGVLAIVFGVYTPIMELLANPKKNFKNNLSIMIPLVLGAVIGFILLANLLQLAFTTNANITLWLFIGLIIGTLPDMYKEAGSQIRNRLSYMYMILSGVVLLLVLGYVTYFASITISPTPIAYVFCGILWALGSVIPGLSSSAILISLGLYEPLLNSFTSFDVIVYVCALPAMIITVFTFAKVFVWLLKKYHSYIMHAVFGITVATTVLIIPVKYYNLYEIVFCIVSGCVGFIVASYMSKLDSLK